MFLGATKKRLYPIGRLDRNTTGLLIFTNDGELSEKLTHPSYKIKKIYHVTIDTPIQINDFKKIEKGFQLDGEKIKIDEIAILDKEKKNKKRYFFNYEESIEFKLTHKKN